MMGESLSFFVQTQYNMKHSTIFEDLLEKEHLKGGLSFN